MEKTTVKNHNNENFHVLTKTHAGGVR